MQEIEPIDSAETTSSVENDHHSEAPSEEEEEDECRVCRGPAEEGRPLYAPCKCSGSIGLTHQDCLTSWLAVTRGTGQCELCGYRFQFAPRYKEGTPDHLPSREVFLGLIQRASKKWLPMTVRILSAMLLWLGVVPLLTAYLYHGWMHRPSSILARFKWELVAGDAVSGVVIASFIIVTFLAFMSFADFLRFNWNDGNNNAGDGNNNNAGRGGRQPRDQDKNRGDWDMAVVQLEIINRMKEYVSRATTDFEDGSSLDDVDERRHELQQMRELVHDMEKLIRPMPNEVPRTQAREQELQRHEQTRELLEMLEKLEEENEELRERAKKEELAKQALHNSLVDVLREQQDNAVIQVEDASDEEGDDDLVAPLNNDAGNRDIPLRQQERLEQVFPPLAFDPPPPPQAVPGLNPEDDPDMDINLALDELLGLRGPFNILIRNVCWLLAFNTTYLGLFAFIPKNFGASMHSLVLNRTSFSSWMYNTTETGEDEELPFPRLIAALNDESSRLDTTLRLPDLATITLGYLSLALLVVIIQLGVYVNSKATPPHPEDGAGMNGHVRGQRDHAPVGDALAVENRLPPPRVADNNQAAVGQGEADELGGLGDQLMVALNCLKALTKVGFLLFHKMLLLPLVLGIWLDSATLALFGSSPLERSLNAGSDLFSSALLHWVAGITFMLFVTVSVLQLREVAHPGILARVIRPQEPQPDLLSNLLHESVATHAKRMLLSFLIYAALLSLYVLLPARILISTGIGQYLPFARPHFYHFLMPQLQIPLELLVFHFTMLALLERYKNRIGGLQHHWLVFTCDKLGLTEFLLPRYIEKFELLGSRYIFLRHLNVDSNSGSEDESDGPEEMDARRKRKALVLDIGRVDPFWYELVSKKDNMDEFLAINLDMLDEPHPCRTGLARPNGERIPANMQEVIVLPPNWTQQESSLRIGDSPHAVTFLPTSIGPYRLCRRLTGEKAMVVDIYKEIPGDPVPRPPDGWDDLGVGGAEVQGRWAWAKEKKSTIENGVAHRSRIFHMSRSWKASFYLILKGIFVAMLSWFVIAIIGCLALSFPLVAGRSIYALLRVPDRYVHDPLAFAIGLCLWRPTYALVSLLWKGDQSILGRILQWISTFRLPPFRKAFVVSTALVLWLVVSPLALGILYDLFLVKSRSFFSGQELSIDKASLLSSWATGTMLLNIWALLCYCSVFTWNFWVVVGNAALDAEVEGRNDGPAHQEADGLVHEQQNVDDDERQVEMPGSAWQGQDGKIYRFVDILIAGLFQWEWDVVDHEILLEECAVPVAKHVVKALVIPCVVFVSWLYALSLANQLDSSVVLPVIGEVDNALYRACIFRFLVVMSLVAQIAASNRRGLRRWFKAAHQAARDGRYLEGEILLNYETE